MPKSQIGDEYHNYKYINVYSDPISLSRCSFNIAISVHAEISFMKGGCSFI